MNLGPVREARLGRARAQAEQLLSAARQEAAAVVETAEAEAALRVRLAREEGRSQAEREAEYADRGGAEEARRLVLRARRDAIASLDAAARRAALDCRQESFYPALVRRLTALGLGQLGPAAVAEAAPGGGVVLRAGPRRVDYSLPELAGRWVESLGPRLEELWR